MAWFNYRQNNSGGSFNYDERNGISVEVFVEADNANDANDRAEAIGIYFDGAGDCACCGDRWYAQYDNSDSVDEVPEPDAPFIKDERSYSRMKWIDGYETFVHPLDGKFYGAHKDVKVINPHIYGDENGYGLRIWRDEVSKVFPVNVDGWDKTGNESVPAHGRKGFGDGEVVEFESGFYARGLYNPDYYSVWFYNKADAQEYRKRVMEFQAGLPKFSMTKMIES